MDGSKDCHTEWSKSDTNKYHMILFICETLKVGTNELIYKTEVESQVWKTNLWLPGAKWGREKLGDWDWHIDWGWQMHTTIDN